MATLREMLEGADRRKVGRAQEVAALVLAEPGRLGELLRLATDPDPAVAMRAADAAEKATALRPSLLDPFKLQVLGEVARSGQKEVRWHAAQLLPRLALSEAERRVAAGILRDYLGDPSSIVRTFAMQALTDLALRDYRLAGEVLPLVEHLAETGTPAMRSRGRKLVPLLRKAME